jgi:hypothetical protein
MNLKNKRKLNLISEYKKVGGDEFVFLYKVFGDYDGGIQFVDASAEALKLSGRDLVWWCGMIKNYHHHPDYLPGSLVRTRKHFKNLALRYLNSGEYDTFKTWIRNWSNMLIVGNFLAPELWENFEGGIKDPVRNELGYEGA